VSAVALCPFVCLLFILCREYSRLVPMAGVSLSQVAPRYLCGVLCPHKLGSSH